MKLGLWGSSTTEEAVAVLRAARDAVDGDARGRRRRLRRRRARAEPAAAAAAARRRGAARRAWTGACSTPRSRTAAGCFDWLAPDALAAIVADAHDAGLEIALAGELRAEDLPAVRATRGRHRRRALGRLPRRAPHGAARPRADRAAARGLRRGGARAA